ncbi:MAG: hypothetical protein H5U40_13150 [Polyangiaceae bacterium]|nr:hypothetical protein [Polyangiaceae bacterium]
MSNHLRRERLSGVLAALCVVACVGFSVTLTAPGALTVWSFYVFGDLFTTLMVAGFFAFLNDSVDPDSAKRTYGLIGLGGVFGGVFGSMVIASFIDLLDRSGWALVCAGLCTAVLLVAVAAGRALPRRERPLVPAALAREPSGARLVLASRYLLAILGIVSVYEIVSTLMDYQFSWTIAHYLDGDAIGRQFSRVFLITNVVSMCVQLFVTTPVMRRRGVTTALLVLPMMAGLGSLGFAIVPALWVGSLLNTCDNAFSYSIHQSAKESLYVPRTEAEKYKAKAFIDMFGQRVAKGVGVLLSLGVAQLFTGIFAVRSLSMVTLALIVVWVYLARYVGRRFDEAASEGPRSPPMTASRRVLSTGA